MSHCQVSLSSVMSCATSHSWQSAIDLQPRDKHVLMSEQWIDPMKLVTLYILLLILALFAHCIDLFAQCKIWVFMGRPSSLRRWRSPTLVWCHKETIGLSQNCKSYFLLLVLALMFSAVFYLAELIAFESVWFAEKFIRGFDCWTVPHCSNKPFGFNQTVSCFLAPFICAGIR